MRRRLGLLAGVLAVALVTVGVGAALGAFSSTASSSSNSFSAARIFPGDRSMAAHDLRDASSGTESNKSEPFEAAGDGLTFVSSTNMLSGGNKYIELTINSARPTGLAVTGAQFDLSLATSGGQNACFWFDVRSGGSVIGTHGSYASPVGCSSGATQTQFHTAMPEVATTDDVNGLVIRIYSWDTASKKVAFDLGTVSGSTAYGSFTSYARQMVDASGATPVTSVWSLASVDAVTYTDLNNWPTAASATKYLKFTFDPDVPAGAVVSSATLTLVWKPSANLSSPGLCQYTEVLSGTTPLATHGSSSSPYSCNRLSGSYVTDAIPISEVNTVAQANAVNAKVHMWAPANAKVNVDQAQLTLNYYLP